MAPAPARRPVPPSAGHSVGGRARGRGRRGAARRGGAGGGGGGGRAGAGAARAPIRAGGGGGPGPGPTNAPLGGGAPTGGVGLATPPEETLAAEGEGGARGRREAPPAEEPR